MDYFKEGCGGVQQAEEAGLEGLEESDIDRQALNCLHTVPCTEEILK